jgi:hypothetical protein
MNNNFSSKKKIKKQQENKNKVNKNLKNQTKEFSISLNTLNTKGSLNIKPNSNNNFNQSSEKSNIKILKKENIEKIIELNPITDDSDMIEKYLLYENEKNNSKNFFIIFYVYFLIYFFIM